MQLMNSQFVDQFGSSVVEAIWSPDKWGDVLDGIIETTPACAAIITLRDKKNCQIVNDQQLERTYHSPLIRGFSMESVGYYLTELRALDPWAEYQRTNYPFRPMLMSAACPPEKYPGNRFFEWLKRLEMSDTVVFELDRMAGYWSACNLFLPDNNEVDAQKLMQFVERNFKFLRNAWQTSQKIEHNRQTEKALLEHFDHSGQPCCLLGANGELHGSNSKFDSLVDLGHLRISGPNKKVSFDREIQLLGLDTWEDHGLVWHDGPLKPLTAVAKPVEPDSRFNGKREKTWVLVFYGSETVAPVPMDARHSPFLSEQEQAIFDAVVNGCSVEKAGARIGIRRSRAFDIWKSVKDKMSITNTYEVRRKAKL